MARRGPARTALLVALLVAFPACERPEEQPPPVTHEPAPPAPDLYPVEIEPGIALGIRKLGPREYMMYGSTDRARSLRLSVEDGHHILFGPAEIEVDDERFRIDFLIEPTDRDHIFFYLTDGAGERLAVVPVDTARELTTAGPPTALPSPSPPGIGRLGDSRTRVIAMRAPAGAGPLGFRPIRE